MLYFSCRSPHQANQAREGGIVMSLTEIMVALLISIAGSILGTPIVQMLGW